jgi:hypothetical protein
MSEGVAVEYGPRDFPLIYLLRDDFIKDKQLAFVERDVDKSQLERLRNKLNTEGVDSSKIVVGDAANFGMKNVDTIFSKDLFGQQDQIRVSNSRVVGKTTEVGSVYDIAKTWHTNCNEDGRVVILEMGTPPRKADLIQNFKKAGFSLEEDYDNKEDMRKIFGDFKDEYIPDKALLIDGLIATSSYDSYALVFRKK